jgi:outer membrane protein assembly factor BamB
MTFCIQCASYLPPAAVTCTNCGASQPSAPSLTVLWCTDLDQPPAGPPLVTDDLLLVPTQESRPPSHNSALYALSLADGSKQWEYSFDYALISGLATVQTLKVSETFRVLTLVATASSDLLRGQGMLLALDHTGEERWRWAPGVQRLSAPTIADDLVCVAGDAQTLLLLDPLSGEERASLTLPVSASLSAPAIAGNVAYVPCRGPHLLAVGLDGGLRWRFDAQAAPDVWLDQTPIVAGERLFTTSSAGTVVALCAADGSPAWQRDVGPAGKRLSPPSTGGQYLYVGARDGLYALDLSTGEMVWTFPTPRRVSAMPIVAGGVVYVNCHDHHLYALDAADGQEQWRYEAAGRLTVHPGVAFSPEARVFVVDRDGTVTAVARPLSAAEHEAAGHWIAAASAYAAQGQFARGAELLAAHDEPFKAAELWKAAGETERAAEQYELAGAWQQAADLWERLGRLRKHAAALEEHARALADQSPTDEEGAAAWAAAALAYEIAGEIERAEACEWQVARYTRQPIISMEVKHEGLVWQAWSRLKFTVRNDGYGPARNLIVRASGDQFEGQVMTTRQIITLDAGRQRIDRLDIRPLQHGDSVPLRVQTEYFDQTGQLHAFEQTLYLPVASSQETRGAAEFHHISAARTVAPSPEAARLHHILITYFSLEELRTLCFQIGVNYDFLAGEELRGKARELLLHLQRQDALSRLTAWLQGERPDIDWDVGL